MQSMAKYRNAQRRTATILIVASSGTGSFVRCLCHGRATVELLRDLVPFHSLWTRPELPRSQWATLPFVPFRPDFPTLNTAIGRILLPRIRNSAPMSDERF